MKINDHIESIAKEIQDYREGEIDLIDEEHIEKWLNQFDKENRLIIAREIDHIVHHSYLKKSDAKKFFKAVLADKRICGNLSTDYKKIKFLNIQRKGNSQSEMLDIIKEILVEDYNLSLSDFGTMPEKYIYVDDCLFSGNTLFYDLRDWISENADIDVQLHVVNIVCYSRGYYSTKKRIEELTKGKNIRLSYWHAVELFNNNNNYKRYDCCWSVESDEPNEDIEKYLEHVNKQCESKTRGPRLFRNHTNDFEETLFTCYEGRLVIEESFMKYGAYITGLPKNLQYSMRPLGYEKYESLGFGAMFITYRNIANNCPLVLWWGDANMHFAHPFSKWHPLFPRKTNKNENWWE